ncbi:dihydrodipicolinate synthase family protein [Paenarthrobacter nicotinovorans]|uniref:dihydrodipicolinate synthase family protein n=1 Tax=Paenarthrobacter nicotinovorans TaxID=29320 RepID=UPI00374A9074
MLAGVFTALLTPFTPDGRVIDEERLRQLARAQISAGISGLVACGSTAEFATLTTQERKRVVEILTDEARGHVPVIAQTGSPSTEVAIELSRHAEEHGAAALLLAVPYYGPVDDEDIIKYHRDVADSVGLPLMAYNFPAASGVSLDVDFLKRLTAAVPEVKFVKDSSGDRVQLLQLAEGAVPGLQLWGGDEGLFGTALGVGVRGFILGAGNIAPEALTSAFHAAEERNDQQLESALESLAPLFTELSNPAYTAAVKIGVEVLSGPVGPVRRPIKEADADTVERMKEIVTSL